jgi:hypothetical protein
MAHKEAPCRMQVREIPLASLCRKSPLLAQRTREMGPPGFSFLWWAAGPWALRVGSDFGLRCAFCDRFVEQLLHLTSGLLGQFTLLTAEFALLFAEFALLFSKSTHLFP